MRILCLHGQGTSGTIFKSQLSGISKRLTAHLPVPVEFDYLDGPYPSPPAPGVDLFYPPPYFTFWRENTVPAVRETIAWLNNIIAERGPYDAVMMFSQGCALGASMLLLQEWESRNQHQHQDQFQGHGEKEQEEENSNTTSHSQPQKDKENPPFSAAIFICGGPPLQILSEEIGYALPESIFSRDKLSRTKLAQVANSDSLLALGSQRWNNKAAGGGSADEEEKIRQEIASYGDVRIQIPTVHVYGDKDPRYEASVQLSGLCEEGRRRTFNHNGGHEIPRLEAVTARVTEMTIWALREGGVID
ncbi:putative EF-hand calcium-binding domain protein [Aspergillus melleus]|uniref:putative EF-hand calcium-binding domain protein n=1 Tax=Aspergillus melleus TaxID=138277 RepID=UPI001E8CB322|nr:uncharacterized protein LDX57_008298 [Aspergillus melleus]KAH8430635.1 hypothetical protein LDX57_008298 [Aspergillus melleus]